MQKLYILLLLSIPIISADISKEDICLNALQNSVAGKKILIEFTREKLTPTIIPEAPLSSGRNAVGRTHSGSTTELAKQKKKKTSLVNILLKKKSCEIHSTKDKNLESMKISLMSLRFNVLLCNIYGEKGNEFNYKARTCINNLRDYHESENQTLQSDPIKEDDNEADKIFKQVKQRNNDSLHDIIEKYEKIVSKQIEHEKCDLSQLASDIPKIIATNLYSLSPERSNDLFNTIDLILMRSAEIFIQVNDWNEKGKKIKEFENIIETISYYRKKQSEEVKLPTIPNVPLKVEYLREILDTQKKLLA